MAGMQMQMQMQMQRSPRCHHEGRRAAASESWGGRSVKEQRGAAALGRPAKPSLVLRSAAPHQVTNPAKHEMQDWISQIKQLFHSFNSEAIAVSSYDIAWIAMVPSLDGSRSPQFPQCIDWLINNQLPDGSWGNREVASLSYNHVSSTIASIIALTTWNIGHDNIQKGIDFMYKNIENLNESMDEHFQIGFEVSFLGMLEDAKCLGIDLPYNSYGFLQLEKEGKKKSSRNPLDLVHTYPTLLPYSLEGIHKEIQWEMILPFMKKDGSFLCSLATIACALKYTKDQHCFNHLNMMLQSLNNAEPFEPLNMVDMIERLGITRFFNKEIKDTLNYVHRQWGPNGIAQVGNTNAIDIGSTAIAFRLLRLHGYSVSTDIFNNTLNVCKDFVYNKGEINQVIRTMYNLCRATHVAFPGETILEDLEEYTSSFLKQIKMNGTSQENSNSMSGLHGEVSYTLNYPWIMSLNRLDVRNFIENFNSEDRNSICNHVGPHEIPNIAHKTLLQLAKMDYNLCQSSQQSDLKKILRWNKHCKFDKLRFARQRCYECMFTISATLFEPEYSLARVVFTTCSVIVTILDDLFDSCESLQELSSFVDAIKSYDPSKTQGLTQDMKTLFMGLSYTMDMINQEAYKAQGRNIICYLQEIFVRYIEAQYLEAEWRILDQCPSFDSYIENAMISSALEIVVRPSLLFLGESLSPKDFANEEHAQMLTLVQKSFRFMNDIRGFEVKKEDKWTCVSLFLEENLHATPMEAIEHFKYLSKFATKELARISLRDTIVSKKIKGGYLDLAKSNNLFYKQVDGYSFESETKEYVENTLIIPIS